MQTKHLTIKMRVIC